MQGPIIITPNTIFPRQAKRIKWPQSVPTVATAETLTAQEQLEAFIKFAAQCYIRSGTKLIPFAPLYSFQFELARLAIQYRGLIVIKDRQLGITELFLAWMLERATRNPAYASCTFSLTEKDAFKASGRVKRMPSKIEKFDWDTESMGIRRPLGGGELNFRPATENATRGLESIWDLLFDEAGFIKSNLVSEMYAASTPSQEMVGDENARTIIVSTIPKDGIDTWYWGQVEANNPDGLIVEEMLEIAKSGGYLNLTKGAEDVEPIPGFVAWEDESGWVKVIISHKAHPVYGDDPEYLENQRRRKKLTEEQLQREFNLTLPRAGASLFNAEAIEQYAIGKYEPPHRGHYYLAGLDPNMGGDDEWYLTIWDITSYPIKLVAEYHESNRLPSYCRQKSLKLLDQYKPVLLGIEKNNGGLTQAEDFIAARPRLLVEVINTSSTSKIMNTDRISISLTDGDVIYPKTSPLKHQMKKFSAKDREGIGNAHDDAVCSWMIAFACLEQALSLRTDISWIKN